MGTTTPLLGLYQPASGETGWGANVNANMTTLDSPMGRYAVSGLVGNNNSGAPNTQYDLAADAVCMMNPTNKMGVTRVGTGTLTNNISTAGPAANGRDQAGAFTAATWIHFYFIWNGSATATLSSATAPPTGPTLPSGYTHWAYCGAVYFNGSSQLLAVRMRGQTCFYDTHQSFLSTNSPATAETALGLSALLPPNAVNGLMHLAGSENASAGGGITHITKIRVVSGADFYSHQQNTNASTAAIINFSLMFPNISQQIFYLNTNNTNVATAQYDAYLTGYTVPNGDA